MPSIAPPKTPTITRDETIAFLSAAGLTSIDRAVLFGRRGYFADYGEPGNDFGVYDDAIVLISPTAFVAYNANTDPSVKKPKVAVLQTGRWVYKLGTHNRNKAVDQQYPTASRA